MSRKRRRNPNGGRRGPQGKPPRGKPPGGSGGRPEGEPHREGPAEHILRAAHAAEGAFAQSTTVLHTLLAAGLSLRLVYRALKAAQEAADAHAGIMLTLSSWPLREEWTPAWMESVARAIALRTQRILAAQHENVLAYQEETALATQFYDVPRGNPPCQVWSDEGLEGVFPSRSLAEGYAQELRGIGARRLRFVGC